jgi:DNA anti-recombination protein RmuC
VVTDADSSDRSAMPISSIHQRFVSASQMLGGEQSLSLQQLSSTLQKLEARSHARIAQMEERLNARFDKLERELAKN